MQVPNWKEVFDNSTLPLMVDIGSGKIHLFTFLSVALLFMMHRFDFCLIIFNTAHDGWLWLYGLTPLKLNIWQQVEPRIMCWVILKI